MLHRFGAFFIMLLGAGTILFTVGLMNGGGPPKADRKDGALDAIVVEPVKKKKPRKQRVQRKRRKAQQTRRVSAPPLPNLDTALSGASYGLPEFDVAGLQAETMSALGDTKAVRDVVMTQDAVDNPPRPVAPRSPQYPARARAKGITGRVVLSVLVGERGDVLRVKVVDATPPGIFEQAAMDSVREWRFEPATYRGQQVKVWVRQPIHFDLT